MAYGNYSYNPYMNPYASPYSVQQMPNQIPQSIQPPQNGFVWVDGIDEANAFYVAPNNSVPLWDKNSPTIYKKSADSTGRQTMQIFDLVERQQKPTENPDFVLRTEFEELKAKIDKLTEANDE